MKKTLTKLLVSLLIILILTNHCLINVSQANVLEAFAKGANAAWGVVVEAIEDILGTVVGIFAIIPKIIVLPLSLSAQSFMATIAYSQGTVDADGNIKNATIFNTDTWYLTPFDIIFNKVALVDVDIFNIPSTPGAIKSIREAAAGWYYVMRTIAAAILLCVLIYVGIRMALSTVASDKATYKKMLVDWAASLALIFLLQYIIIFTFAINSALIKALESVSRSNGVSTAILKLYGSALFLDIDSIAATIVICMLTWQTMSLLISYISRMLKVTFLVIISPLITLTYSIDKMGDGKAQALNLWLKEFIYTVLLQAFHCVIYVAFIGIAIEMLGIPIFDWDDNNIGAAVLCILCIHFTKEAEKILGKIFSFSDSTSGASLATGMVAAAALAKNAKSLGKGARNVVNGVKNARPALSNAAVTAGTLSGILKGKDAATARQNAQAKVDRFNNRVDNSMDKVRDGARNITNRVVDATAGAAFASILTARSNRKEDQERIEAKATDIVNNTGMSRKEALSHARAEVRRENKRFFNEQRKESNKSKNTENKRRIKEAVTYWNKSDSKKQFNNAISSMVSMGTGIFVGAGSFGLGDDAIKSIMLGTAASSGTKEFFNRSTNRLANDNAQLMQGAGITTRRGAQAYLGQIAGREDELKDVSKALDKIYGDIAAALTGLDETEQKQVKGTIKNIVEQSLLNNPTASTNDIKAQIAGNELIQSAFAKTTSGKTLSDFSKSLDGGINLQRDSKVYQNIANARDWGLRPEVIMDDSVKRFHGADNEGASDSYSGNSVDGPGGGGPTNSTDDGGNNPTPQEENGQESNNSGDGSYVHQEDIRTFEDLPPEVQNQIKDEMEARLREYNDAISSDSTSDEAARMILEREFQVASEEGQRMAKKLLEDQAVIKQLLEQNESLESIIDKLRKMKGL